MRVAYFVNQYPAISHTFIRREIQALERVGVTVIRFALFSPVERLVDDRDRAELEKTRLVQRAGIAEALRCIVAAFAMSPRTTIKIFGIAIRMGWRSTRGVLRHLAYVAEAAVLASWCKAAKVEHLHAHFGTNSAAIAMFASLLSGIRYSFTAHGSEEFEFAPLLSLDVKLSYAAFAVCVSSFGRAQLMRWSAPEQWPKVKMVHCGIDASFLDSPLQDPPSTPRFVCVGRLCEHKAQIILIEAVRLLRELGIRCDVVLAGDGEMRPQVENAIREYQLQEQVSISGWVPSERVKAEILGSRALILPSFSENMPVSIMEAMALGRPVISTYVAGIPELVQPNINGWLVPAGDVTALATAIQAALDTPDDRLIGMGKAARAHIFDQFNAAKEAKKLKRLFRHDASAAAPTIAARSFKSANMP